MDPELLERMKRIRKLSLIPMKTEREMRMVEIIILKFKEEPKVINACVTRIVNYTQWPFKLTIYDNRQNTANTAKIWNKLIRESTCDYVALIDSDAFVSQTTPCWLTRLMESVDKRGIVYSVGDNVGGINGGVTEAVEYPKEIFIPEDVKRYKVRPAEEVCSGYFFLVKKSVMEKVGWFDEDFYLYGQDSEWCWRAKKTTGFIIRPDVFIAHIGSYSAVKDDKTGFVDRMPDRQFARHLWLKKTGVKIR